MGASRTAIPLAWKTHYIELREAGVKKWQGAMREHFKKDALMAEYVFASGTWSDIWVKQKTNLASAASSGNQNPGAKKLREGKVPQLEKVLQEWINRKEAQDADLSDDLIIEKAKEFGKRDDIPVPDNFQFSSGWVKLFKRRKRVKQHTKMGEAASADGNGVKAARTFLPLLFLAFAVRLADIVPIRVS
jgi:hypothetical protein